MFIIYYNYVVFVSVAVVLLCYSACRVMGHNVCYFYHPLCLGLRLCCNYGVFPLSQLNKRCQCVEFQ